MYRWLKYMVFVMLLLPWIGVQGTPVDSIAASVDTLHVEQVKKGNRLQRMRDNVKERIERKMNEPYDTVHDDGYWLRALKHGKVDFADSTIHYPDFVRWGWNVYKWGDRTFNSYDPNYVVSTGKNWKLTFKNNNWIDTYSCRPFPEARFRFHSGAASSMGAYLSFMAVTLGYSVDIDRLVGDRGTSKKWELSFTCARFTAEAYRMTNTGNMTFTMHDEESDLTFRFSNFSGFHRESKGVSAYYFFNHHRYAQAAAYCFSKRQLRSAGSWMAGFNISRQSFSLDSGELSEMFVDEDTEDEIMFDYTDYCLSGGWGYNWVLGQRWLLNGTILLHTGIKHAHTGATYDSGSDFFAINSKARFGLTYSHRSFFAALQGYIDGHLYNSGNFDFRSFIFDLTAIVGVRF